MSALKQIKAKSAPSLEFSPFARMRRLRKSDAMRDMLRETHLTVNDLVFPMFVEEELDERTPIGSLPGIYRETERTIGPAVKQAWNSGIKSIMLFGISHHKDGEGSDSWRKGGLLDRMVSRAREACPEIVIMADLCFCEYTDHGHCGPLNAHGDVDNDATLENLAMQAACAAAAGADIVAPSGMMDGMVGAIREGLDREGHTDTAILSYAAKFASSFYGPFRDAAGCSLGAYPHARKDRATYQMDPANAEEALREVAIDIEEGADMVMVKPGLPYLDILTRVKAEFQMPTFVYNVSGEYAMLKHAAAAGALDYDKAVMEMLLAFKRAGADGILTYAAPDAARLLENG
ncbi:MAG: porphobilinogen synthase [Rhodospirillales bacterium]|nr:porphobilinogen synthase [Rhodospirillales bacterium]